VQASSRPVFLRMDRCDPFLRNDRRAESNNEVWHFRTVLEVEGVLVCRQKRTSRDVVAPADTPLSTADPTAYLQIEIK